MKNHILIIRIKKDKISIYIMGGKRRAQRLTKVV